MVCRPFGAVLKLLPLTGGHSFSRNLPVADFYFSFDNCPGGTSKKRTFLTGQLIFNSLCSSPHSTAFLYHSALYFLHIISFFFLLAREKLLLNTEKEYISWSGIDRSEYIYIKAFDTFLANFYPEITLLLSLYSMYDFNTDI